MTLARLLLNGLLSLALAVVATAAADEPTFRSEVSLSRIDARVVDRDGHAVTGLTARDFVIKLGDKELPVRNFANENTPIDILLLLDVSGSMEPHVERIATAAHQALQVLGDQDRVGIMVFDSRTRVRLPFRNSHGDVTGELNRLMRAETFNGGTRITSAMLDAARYVEKEARPEARRAIVILTDDMTQDQADEGRVEKSLRSARAIMSFLQAPYEEPSGFGGMPPSGGRRRGTWGTGGGGGGWPGSGGGIGFPGGGGGWPGGRGGGGGVPMSSPSHSAGTETIAFESGGDSMNVNDAAALEETLARLRQRYALYFYLPEGMTESKGNSVRVALSEMASMHYHGAELQSRRVFMSGGDGGRNAEPATVTRVAAPPEAQSGAATSTRSNSESVSTRRGRAVNEDSGSKVNTVSPEAEEPKPAASNTTTTPTAASPAPQTAPAQKGGWPKATDKPNPPNQFSATRD